MKIKRAEGVWFDYPDDPLVSVKVNPVPWSKALEVRSKVKKKLVIRLPNSDPSDPTPEKTEIIDDFDEFAYTLQLFFYIFEDWKGIEVGEATRKEIKELVFDYPPLRDFIFAKSNELTESLAKREDRELKNSVTSQDG